MSNIPGLPPGNEIPQGTPQIQIPLIGLQGVGLRIDTMPDGNRILVIGPVALGIMMDEKTSKWLNENTSAAAESGIVIARAGAVPGV